MGIRGFLTRRLRRKRRGSAQVGPWIGCDREGKYASWDSMDRVRYVENLYPELSRRTYVMMPPMHGKFMLHVDRYVANHPDRCRDVVYDSSPIDSRMEQTFTHSRYDEDYGAPVGEHCSCINNAVINGINFDLVIKYTVHNDVRSLLFFDDFEAAMAELVVSEVRRYEPGIYQLAVNQADNSYYLDPFQVSNSDRPILEEATDVGLDSDVRGFFENREFYREKDIPFKRGILLYGPPGTGKTTFVRSVLGSYRDTYRILIDCGQYFSDGIYKFLSASLPAGVPKIIVFEDVESITGGDRGSHRRSAFLNFIDGAKTVENTVFIATTNNLDLVDKALLERPSRFDRLYKFGYPPVDCRRRHVLRYFPELEQEPARLDAIVKDTEGFSGAFFKELMIRVGIQGVTVEQAVRELRQQIRTAKNLGEESRGMGLGLGDGN